MTIFIYDQAGTFVAQIVRQSKLAVGFLSHEPWLLLRNSGRVERFELQGKAKNEARKSWVNCRFART